MVTGLVFALLLIFIKRSDQPANRFLGLALAMVVFWTMGLPAIDSHPSAYLTYWIPPPQLSLILGPLIYFYVLKKINPEYNFRRWDLIHFSPLLFESGNWFLQAKEPTPPLKQLNLIMLVLAFISVTAYLCRSYSIVKTFRRWLKFNAEEQDKYQLRWLQRLLVIFGITWLLPSANSPSR